MVDNLTDLQFLVSSDEDEEESYSGSSSNDDLGDEKQGPLNQVILQDGGKNNYLTALMHCLLEVEDFSAYFTQHKYLKVKYEGDRVCVFCFHANQPVHPTLSAPPQANHTHRS